MKNGTIIASELNNSFCLDWIFEMNSRRKRKEGPPVAEDLIVSSGKAVSKSTGRKGSQSNSEFTEKRKDSILSPDYDDNVMIHSLC